MFVNIFTFNQILAVFIGFSAVIHRFYASCVWPRLDTVDECSRPGLILRCKMWFVLLFSERLQSQRSIKNSVAEQGDAILQRDSTVLAPCGHHITKYLYALIAWLECQPSKHQSLEMLRHQGKLSSARTSSGTWVGWGCSHTPYPLVRMNHAMSCDVFGLLIFVEWPFLQQKAKEVKGMQTKQHEAAQARKGSSTTVR